MSWFPGACLVVAAIDESSEAWLSAASAVAKPRLESRRLRQLRAGSRHKDVHELG